jgi:hypothetical protein
VGPHQRPVPSQDMDFQCHMSWSLPFLHSMDGGERWLFLLLIMVKLLTGLNFSCLLLLSVRLNLQDALKKKNLKWYSQKLAM